MARFIGFTCYGPVRGCCDKVHGVHDRALRCLEKDRTRCSSQGGYSDREICTIGDDGLLYEDKDCTEPIPAEGGMSNGAVRF
jgi:hypothetical protein